ncbi:hypothetical protein FG386_001926 [Cryptosporidium ryanae]|uniref:uncharacterized protein n=1 Tax=Cryptosporidium ryanae TaxID=515981 RepID=UPI00351A931B|nr:hypothetical protein FG386_001926 [Cryptosporidium ryanae]
MRKCVNKQKGTQRASVFGRRSNGCEKNRWPANIDTTILTSFSRNVISKEIEYVQEARRYMGKHRAKGASDVGLNCLLSGLNDRYPSDSLMSKLMNNPDSILFFYNVIQSLLSSEADVSIVVFSVQSLCRSLVKHKNCLFSMDRRVENTLVELSMSLAEHIQTTHSRNNELTSLMNACTCLLLILSSNPYRHFGGIMNDIERISKKVVFEFENGVVSLDKDANWLSYLHLDDDLHSKSSRGLELELAAFLSHVKCLDSVADIYKLLNERPTLLTLSKKSDVENLILLLATNVLCLLDGMIGAYFKISTGIERGDARVPFLHSVFTLLVESFLKWISTSEEVNLRSTSEHSTDLCVVSKFPKTIELIALSIYNDPISDEITRIITDFMSSYSRHLTIANKDSAKAAYASKKLLVSSLVISNSLSSSSKSFPEEPTRLPKNLNWFKVLTRYFQTFSSAISPLFIVHDLLGLALNFETNESRIRRSDYLLYREWTHTLNCGIIDMVLETVSRHSCAIGSSCHLSYDAPAGLGLDAALPNSDQDRRLCCSRNANTESPEGPHSRERCSSAVRELSGIDLGARDGLASEEVGTTLSGSGCHKAMNKYKNNIRHLYNCLAFAAISGSREHALLSLSAWESFSCSIKLSYSCVHRLQPLLFKLSASKYKSLYKCLNWHSWDDATHGGRDSFTFDRGLCGGGASCSSGFRERERLGFTRLLFDAVVLKALSADSFMEYTVARCALTLLICMGMQNSNVIEVKRRITREKAAREERGRDEASLGSSLCSYDNFYFDASLLPATGRSGGHTSGFPPDRGSLDAICSYFCCACERIDAGRDSSVSMKDIVGDLIRVMDEDCGAASSDQSVGGSRFGTGLGLDFPDTDRGHSAYIDDLSGTSNEASRGVGAECGFEEGLGSDEDDAREESTGTDSDSSDDAEEDDARENGSSFSPLKLITNQRHVVTALKYLLGDFVSGDNGGNRALVLNVFNNTIWGVELVSTVFLVLMDPHCDSETFSILSDILILIKQLLDKNEFRSVLELAFLRLPIRLFIQSEIVSREFKSLKYSFSNCGYLNLDIEDYYNFNYHRVNTTNTSKNVDSIVANSINEVVLGLTPIFIYDKYNHLLVVLLYGLSQMLDALDGHFARLFKQETKFGALLDMITDRCSTIVIIVINISLYHNNGTFFRYALILLLVDIAGHWIYMISSIISGNNSHKNTNIGMWAPLKIYYSNKFILFTLHACNELMWIVNYMQYFTLNNKDKGYLNSLFLINRCVLVPFGILKNIMNFIHLIYGLNVLLELDVNERREGK